MFRVLCCIFVAAPLLSAAQSPTENVPVIQGGAGPCSIELTVRGSDGKPVYSATVKVHVKYGFGGMRRLDLEAGTNSDGKGEVRRTSREGTATSAGVSGFEGRVHRCREFRSVSRMPSQTGNCVGEFERAGSPLTGA
jgi:hypothetical protein